MTTIEGRRSKLIFERMVAGVVLANAAVTVWGLVEHSELAEHLEFVCLLVFAAELLWRLLRSRGRFLWGWGLLDVALVGLALSPLAPVSVSVLWVARLGRLLHLGRHVAALGLL